jgi:hypothetical protein
MLDKLKTLAAITVTVLAVVLVANATDPNDRSGTGPGRVVPITAGRKWKHSPMEGKTECTNN